jgi:hypothetical protein
MFFFLGLFRKRPENLEKVDYFNAFAGFYQDLSARPAFCSGKLSRN